MVLPVRIELTTSPLPRETSYLILLKQFHFPPFSRRFITGSRSAFCASSVASKCS